jgi:hypothetical protein
MGDILGIRFEAIEFILELYEIFDADQRRDIFEKIQIIDEKRLQERSKQIAINNQKTKTRKK